MWGLTEMGPKSQKMVGEGFVCDEFADIGEGKTGPSRAQISSPISPLNVAFFSTACTPYVAHLGGKLFVATVRHLARASGSSSDRVGRSSPMGLGKG
jgi:hypothetical protein